MKDISILIEIPKSHLLYIDKMSLLETKIVFKAYEKDKDGKLKHDGNIREFTREVTITGRHMEDINRQAEKVAAYLKEQTGMTWVIEVSDYKDVAI